MSLRKDPTETTDLQVALSAAAMSLTMIKRRPEDEQRLREAVLRLNQRVEPFIPRDESGLEELRARCERDGDHITTENDCTDDYRTGYIGITNPQVQGHLVHGDVVIVTNAGERTVLERVDISKLCELSAMLIKETRS